MVGMAVKMVCGNREVLVPTEEKEMHLKRGYSVIDAKGNIVEKGEKTKRDLEAELAAVNRKNLDLEAELLEVNKKNADLEVELKKALTTKAETTEKKK